MVLLATVRPAAVVTFGVLAVMAFVNGWRSMLASAVGMETAPEDKLAVMAMRAAANQFGYLVGAAAGGAALAVGGFPGLGVVLAAMFAAAAAIHAPALAPGRLARRVAVASGSGDATESLGESSRAAPTQAARRQRRSHPDAGTGLVALSRAMQQRLRARGAYLAGGMTPRASAPGRGWVSRPLVVRTG